MIRHALAALCATALAFPALARAQAPFIERTIPAAVELPATANRSYLLLEPEAAPPGKTLPLVIYMHGAGAKGTDNRKQLEALPKLLATPEMRKRFPCYVLVPQCRDGEDSTGGPNNWTKWEGQKDHEPVDWKVSSAGPSEQLQGAMRALDDVLAAFPAIDRARVYLTGVSMGGSAGWNWGARDPGKFAAILPVCGLSETSRAAALGKIPVWTFHGEVDPQVPVDRTRAMVEAVKAAGGTIRYTEYAGGGHGIASRVFTEDDHAVLRWLFGQRRE